MFGSRRACEEERWGCRMNWLTKEAETVDSTIGKAENPVGKKKCEPCYMSKTNENEKMMEISFPYLVFQSCTLFGN